MGQSVTCCFHGRLFSGFRSSSVPHAPLLEEGPDDEHLGLEPSYDDTRIDVLDRRFTGQSAQASYRAPEAPTKPAPQVATGQQQVLDPPPRSHPRSRPPAPTRAPEAVAEDDPFADPDNPYASIAPETEQPTVESRNQQSPPAPVGGQQARHLDSASDGASHPDPPSSDSEAESPISDLEPESNNAEPGPLDENKLEDFPELPMAEQKENEEEERTGHQNQQRRSSSQITTQTQSLKVSGAGGDHVNGTYRWFATHGRFVMFSDGGHQFQIRGGVDLSEYGPSFENCWVLEEITEAENVKLYAVDTPPANDAEDGGEDALTIPSTGWIAIDGARPAPVVKSGGGENANVGLSDVSDFGQDQIITVDLGPFASSDTPLQKSEQISLEKNSAQKAAVVAVGQDREGDAASDISDL